MMTALLVYVAVTHAILWINLIGGLFYLRRHKPSTPNRFPSISAVIPARNEERNIGRLLESLVRQDYPDYEIIVYNDGSEDRTGAIVRDFISRYPHLSIRLIEGDGPPEGWVGKVYALFSVTRNVGKEKILFLDADSRLRHEDALRNFVRHHHGAGENTVLTGVTRLRGGGDLLTSMVINAIMTGLPWWLTKRMRVRAFGALNGQCWMIDTKHYFEHEPHAAVKNEVLEDVMIGRLLTEKRIRPALVNLQDDIEVFMYNSMRDAWGGFRKNAYLMLGGSVATFLFLWCHFVLTYLAAPFLWVGFLLLLFVMKLITDRLGRFPLWVSLLAPISFLLTAILNIDSAVSTWLGRVQWKGRRV